MNLLLSVSPQHLRQCDKNVFDHRWRDMCQMLKMWVWASAICPATYTWHSPLVFRDTLISSHIFSKSSSSSSLMIAWTVSFNAHALWRIWRSTEKNKHTIQWAIMQILCSNCCCLLHLCVLNSLYKLISIVYSFHEFHLCIIFLFMNVL